MLNFSHRHFLKIARYMTVADPCVLECPTKIEKRRLNDNSRYKAAKAKSSSEIWSPLKRARGREQPCTYVYGMQLYFMYVLRQKLLTHGVL
jgi:hypothetical protein